MTKINLIEHIEPGMANVLLTEGETKSLYLKGLALQGDVRNRNDRIYPKVEIERSVADLRERLKDGPVAGECDHPDNLSTSLERVSHLIEDIWMEGSNGIARFKIVDVGLGLIVGGLIKAGLKVGVSSRGQGNVDNNGNVSDYEIHTIDIVANPSAPNAYPKPVFESLDTKRGKETYRLAHIIREDKKSQHHIIKSFRKLLQEIDK